MDDELHGTPLEIFDLPEYFDTAVDIGAHFGTTAVLLGELNDVDLYCLEPNLYNSKVLEENLTNNSIDAVVMREVVSDEAKLLRFYEKGGLASNDHTTKPEKAGDFEKSVVTQSTSLSSRVPLPDRTTFIKIDAEGEEKNILEDVCSIQGGEISGIVEVHEDRLEGGVTDITDIFDENQFRYKQVGHVRFPVFYFTNFEDLEDV